MLLKLKDGRVVAPARMGQADQQEATTIIKVWDQENKDLFDKPALFDIRIEDIAGFLGSYCFAPPLDLPVLGQKIPKQNPISPLAEDPKIF